MFSVVIPAYNAEKFINRSVSSVLKQTYTDFEIVIIDDGSTDGTKSVIEKYDDSRIRYIYQPNGGVSAARNKGIEESRGEFVCFLDSDDEWMENHLHTLNELIKKYSHCAMYITGYDIRLNNGEVVHKSQQILRKVPDEEFASDDGFSVLNNNGYFFNTNTICCRREVFDKVGLFAVGVRNGEDDDMWLRIFSYFSVAISKAVTTMYDRSNCGATGQRVGVYEHRFLSRVDDILASDEVSEQRKKSLRIWRERNRLSTARKYVLSGEKRNAFKMLRGVKLSKVSKKKYLETVLCMFIPSVLVRKRIDSRDAGYYK